MSGQLLSPRYKKALDLVARLFADQRRVLTGVPAVTHLYGVAHIVQQLTDDEDVQIAGLLHDVIEDIPAAQYSADQLAADFGVRVRQLVEAVSHDESRYGKDEARKRYLTQLENAPPEACLISGADLLHNTTDIIAMYAEHTDKIKERFGGDRATRREWFWGGRLEIIDRKLGADHKLVLQLRPALEELRKIHQQIM